VPRRPIDILHCGVVLALVVLALGLAAAGRLADWRSAVSLPLVLAGGMAIVLWVVRRADRARSTRGSVAWRLAADFYPIALVPQVFNCLQPLIDGLGFPNQDAALVVIDRWLLGGHDAAVLTAPLIRPWLNDLLFAAYGSFFLFPLMVGLPMWIRSRETCRRFVFAVVLAFYGSYVGYFFVPARGPRYYQWPADDVRTRVTPLSRFVYDTLNSLEYTKDDVFPSGHVMVTTVCLLAALRFDRRLFWPLLPLGLLLASATIYCRYHYVVDIVVGFALGCATLPAAYAMYDRWACRQDVGRPEGPGSAATA
jgi:membrane-associated phospholipid phosphatase